MQNLDSRELRLKHLTALSSRSRKSGFRFPVPAAALILSFFLVAALSVAAPSSHAKSDPPSGTITVKGSDTMVILGQRWAQEFMKKHPEIKVQVMGGGSGTGIAALLNGSTDIAEASRPMKPQEIIEFIKKYHHKPQEIATALDGIAMFINKSNPINSLSLPQLDKIFRAQVTNWKAVGGKDAPIVLYGRENSSGTYAFFKEHVLKNLDFAQQTQTLPGTAAIINAIEKDPNGIGYGGIGYSEGVKVLNLKKNQNSPAVEPTEANVDNGTYPLSRNLFFYLDPAANKGVVKTYIDFCLGPEGQKIVTQVGYYPLKSKTGIKEKGKMEKSTSGDPAHKSKGATK